MFKTFEILNFGHWDLFGIWDLEFGALEPGVWDSLNSWIHLKFDFPTDLQQVSHQ